MRKTITIKAQHAIITPVCQANKTTMGAFEEAVERLRQEYMALTPLEINKAANFHVKLEVEREINL